MGQSSNDMDKNTKRIGKIRNILQDARVLETTRLAAEYLRAPLSVTHVNRRSFALGQSTRDEIITTNRFILILQGSLRYTVEGRAVTLRAGTQFFVPAWVRRVWSVPRSGACEIIWCEFDEGGGPSQGAGLLRRSLDAPVLRGELAAYRALLHTWNEKESVWSPLQLEAQLKSMLTRFLEFAEGSRLEETPTVVHPRIKTMLRWLAEHFMEPDVLEGLYERAGLTRNYFREQFAAVAQCPPHEYIERLRLRHARYLLHSTNWQLKRIAAEVGYDDPLYFSRLYRRFWKRPPSAERLK